MRFRDRFDAGRQLSRLLIHYRGREDVIVLALRRGGAPIGYEVARALQAPLDVFLVRKLSLLGDGEPAIGVIASGGTQVIDTNVTTMLGVLPQTIERLAEGERMELARRERAYRGDRAYPNLHDKVAILVDDGLATGATMRAAVMALRKYEPTRIIVAVPVGAAQHCEAMKREADLVICLEAPNDLRGVGYWYDDFSQTSDEDVYTLLAKAQAGAGQSLTSPADNHHEHRAQ